MDHCAYWRRRLLCCSHVADELQQAGPSLVKFFMHPARISRSWMPAAFVSAGLVPFPTPTSGLLEKHVLPAGCDRAKNSTGCWPSLDLLCVPQESVLLQAYAVNHPFHAQVEQELRPISTVLLPPDCLPCTPFILPKHCPLSLPPCRCCARGVLAGVGILLGRPQPLLRAPQIRPPAQNGLGGTPGGAGCWLLPGTQNQVPCGMAGYAGGCTSCSHITLKLPAGDNCLRDLAAHDRHLGEDRHAARQSGH